MPVIKKVRGLEVLDSRGRPTVQVTCELESGAVGTASVPSGASTGAAEAVELRDGDPRRYRGLGCLKAVGHVNGEICRALSSRAFENQQVLDRTLIALDGSPDKSRLGANALLGVSLSFGRARAHERGIPLYEQFSDVLQGEIDYALPRPTINLFSGGKHAGQQVPLQDVLVVPAAATTMREALEVTAAVYQAAADLICTKYDMRLLTADEGGLAPPFSGAEAMFEDAVEAIRRAGFEPGGEVMLAIDVASSHFYEAGTYILGERSMDSTQMADQLLTWLSNYPIVSIEDGFSENDWESWSYFKERVGGRALVLGDDLLCTRSDRIRKAIQMDAADALLLKVNQVGTLTEAAEACRLAQEAGWHVTISARSGETEDNWLADLAVGWGGRQIKVGSITQSERLAKYNRLLQIEAMTDMPMVAWPGNVPART